MKRRVLEAVKSVLIVLLVLAVLLLTVWLNWPDQFTSSGRLSALLAPISRLFGAQLSQTPPKVETEGAVSDSAKPILITVQTESGRCSYQMDFDALDAVYENLGGLLGQALDTAGEPEQITADQFRSALGRPGFLFQYSGAIPVRLLAAWLDAKSDMDGACQGFALSVENGSVYFLTWAEQYYRCPTQLSSQTLLQALSSYLPDGTAFSFESRDPSYRRLAPMTLLDLNVQPAVYSVSCSNPCTIETVQQLAARLGFNPYDDSSYTDNQATTIYNDADASLRVTAGGQLTLQADQAEPRFRSASTAPEALTEYAKNLLAGLQQGTLGGARLYLTSCRQEGGSVFLEFEYFIQGVAVQCSSGPAASVTFENGALTELRLLLRTYEVGQDALALLPVRQAVAIAKPGRPLGIVYSDVGADALTAGWRS